MDMKEFVARQNRLLNLFLLIAFFLKSRDRHNAWCSTASMTMNLGIILFSDTVSH